VCYYSSITSMAINGMIDVSDYVEISSCNVSQSCIGMYTSILKGI